jgi:uncharacterized protein YidB (DUF937 family)
MMVNSIGSLFHRTKRTVTNTTTQRDPIMPWQVIYGRAMTGGTLIYAQSFGPNKRFMDLVFCVASHPIAGVYGLYMDRARVQIALIASGSDHSGAAIGYPGIEGYSYYGPSLGGAAFGPGSGAGFVPPTGANGIGNFILSGTSFQPATPDCGHGTNAGGVVTMVRSNDVVTVTVIGATIPWLQAGDKVKIDANGGTEIGDPTLYGTYQVDQVLQMEDTGVAATSQMSFTFLSGGPQSFGANALQVRITLVAPSYHTSIYMEVIPCGVLGQTFYGMTAGTPSPANDGTTITPQTQSTQDANPWTVDCSGVGKALVFLRIFDNDSDSSGALDVLSLGILGPTNGISDFLAGIPQISFLVYGKADVADPRSQAWEAGEWNAPNGYTENSALCVADLLSNPTLQSFPLTPNIWGFDYDFAADIDPAQLSAVADVCDEEIELGNGLGQTEPRYTCNGKFELTSNRGEILQAMLGSCAGRLTTVGGNVVIWPGSWVDDYDNDTIGEGSLDATAPEGITFVSPFPGDPIQMAAGGIEWRPTVPSTELYNGVKGTYIGQSTGWIAADFPPYCQDTIHGYSAPGLPFDDVNLAADGGIRRYLDVHLPFTLSAATAQRLAKIELMRRRQQGTGSLSFNLGAFSITPLDVYQLNLADYFGAQQGSGSSTQIPAIPALVQFAVGSGDTPRSATLGTVPTQGNTLVIVCQVGGGGDAILQDPLLADGWTVAVENPGDASGDFWCYIWYKVAGASEPGTITLTRKLNSGAMCFAVMEWSGVGDFDQAAINPWNYEFLDLSSCATGQTPLTTQPTELVIAVTTVLRPDPPFDQQVKTWALQSTAPDLPEMTELGQITWTESGSTPETGGEHGIDIAYATISNIGSYGAQAVFKGTGADVPGYITAALVTFKAKTITVPPTPNAEWTELLEVQRTRLKFNIEGNSITPTVEIDVQQTNNAIYEWSITEELTPQGYQWGASAGSGASSPPQQMENATGESDATTELVSGGSISYQILVQWPAITDQYVLAGGSVQIRWYDEDAIPSGYDTPPTNGSWGEGPPPGWTEPSVWDAPGAGSMTVGPSMSAVYIPDCTLGHYYFVQIQTVNANGVQSGWVPVMSVLSPSTTVILISGTTVPSPGPAAQVTDFVIDDGTGHALPIYSRDASGKLLYQIRFTWTAPDGFSSLLLTEQVGADPAVPAGTYTTSPGITAPKAVPSSASASGGVADLLTAEAVNSVGVPNPDGAPTASTTLSLAGLPGTVTDQTAPTINAPTLPGYIYVNNSQWGLDLPFTFETAANSSYLQFAVQTYTDAGHGTVLKAWVPLGPQLDVSGQASGQTISSEWMGALANWSGPIYQSVKLGLYTNEGAVVWSNVVSADVTAALSEPLEATSVAVTRTIEGITPGAPAIGSYSATEQAVYYSVAAVFPPDPLRDDAAVLFGVFDPTFQTLTPGPATEGYLTSGPWTGWGLFSFEGAQGIASPTFVCHPQPLTKLPSYMAFTAQPVNFAGQYLSTTPMPSYTAAFGASSFSYAIASVDLTTNIATALSGAPFSAAMVGRPLLLNGYVVTVATYTDPTHVVLAGTITTAELSSLTTGIPLQDVGLITLLAAPAALQSGLIISNGPFATLVQKAQANGESPATVTFPQTPTPGNLLVIAGQVEEIATAATAPPTGWTAVFASTSGPQGVATDYFWSFVYYKIAGASEPTSVVVHTGGDTGPLVCVAMEFTGVDTLDQSAACSTGGTGGAGFCVTGTTGATVQANELVIAMTTVVNPPIVVDSWVLNGNPLVSLFGSVEWNPGTTRAIDVAYGISLGEGTYEATATLSADSANACACIVTFKSSAPNAAAAAAVDGSYLLNATSKKLYGPLDKAAAPEDQWPLAADLSGNQVPSDWDASSGLAQILNKPALATVATSGAYSDLTGTPTIPSAYTLPAATAGALGGVKATVNPGSQFVDGINGDGSLHYDTPAGGGGSGNVPAGGTTGQILKKNSGTDYDTGWEDAPGAAGGTKIWFGSGNPNGVSTDFAPHNMTSPTAPSPYTVTGTGGYYGLYQAFDGNLTEGGSWAPGFSVGVWLQIDIGAGIPKTLYSYSILATEYLAARAPKSWILYGSNDDTTWDTLSTITGQAGWAIGETRNFVCDVCTTAYRYFKIVFSANNGDGYMEVCEMYLYAPPVDPVTHGLGDVFIDTSMGKLYGPMAAGPTWPLIGTIGP